MTNEKYGMVCGKFTCDGTNDNCGREYSLSGGQVLDWEPWNSKPFFASYATVQSAKAAYKDVLSDVGQRMPVLDNHDTRVINETKNGTYSMKGSVGGMAGIPDRETDVKDTANIKGWEPYPSTSWANDYDSDLDGLPDWWENMYGYNPKSKSGDFSDANKDRLGDGWTELERYLEWMARAHYTFASGETQVVDLSQFTRGYDGGTYTVLAPSGVTATVSGSKMTVKLADNFAGAGYVQFTLKDNAGDTFSRMIGVTQMLAESAATPASSSSEGGDPQSSGSEPVSSSSSVGTDEPTGIAFAETSARPFRMSVNGNVVLLAGIPNEANITVMDISGKNVMMQKIVVQTRGTAVVDLQPFGCGIYLVNIRGMGVNGQRMNKTVKVMRR